MLICNSLPDSQWAAVPTLGAPVGVAIFRVAVAEHSHLAPRAAALLPAAEQQRARRYHRLQDSQRFLLGRAALRLLLGAYTGQPPAILRFEPGLNKKPVLSDAPGLHYNVSHSGNWILLAIAATEIGVDVEKIDAQFAFEDILADSFSLPEIAAITQAPDSRRLFYQLWTRKEAFVKATGQGIDEAFRQVPALDGPHALGSAPLVWAVSSFGVAAGYAAAVAYPAALRSQLRFYEVGEEVFGALPG